MKVRLNKRTIDAAKYEGPGSCYLWDTEVRGFGLRIYPSGRLTHLVARVHNHELDFQDYGVGHILGSRTFAASELAHRYGQGLSRGGNPKIRSDLTPRLVREVLERRIRPTEGELIAILLDRYLPRCELTRRLLAAYPSPARLIETLKKTQKLLLAAEQERTKEPTDAFVEVLLGLDLSEAEAERTFTEERRCYLESSRQNDADPERGGLKAGGSVMH